MTYKILCAIDLHLHETVLDMANLNDESIIVITSEYRTFQLIPRETDWICKEITYES